MTTHEMTSRVENIFHGKIEERWDGRPPSAIGKSLVVGEKRVNELGFVDDEQADLNHHGGVDKAIHHYASDHYATWVAEGQIPSGTVPAAFGENISSYGMSETDVCIGDIIRIGGVIVQISQGRQPCWKVAEYTGNKRMAFLFTKTGRTGWYYRVLENGTIKAGDPISLVERLHPEWNVERVTLARLSRKISTQGAEALARLPELAEGWRSAFEKMASGGLKEDTSARLQGK